MSSHQTKKPKVILVVSSVIVTCLAAIIWYFVLTEARMKAIRTNDTAIALTEQGDPAKGKNAIVSYGCAACHTIPGVPGPKGKVGPSLVSFKDRAMIAGVLSNTGDNLAQWIQNPREVDPKTAMPHLGVSAEDARNISAYLYAPE